MSNRIKTCIHIKLNGLQCKSPALRTETRCYFHHRMLSPRPGYALPILEDANALQFSVYEICRALIDGEIDCRKAGVLLYGMQIAQANMKATHPEPLDRERITRESDYNPIASLLQNFALLRSLKSQAQGSSSVTSQARSSATNKKTPSPDGAPHNLAVLENPS